MTIEKHITPYFDDFNSGAGYHQILFKPGYAVQARELTQAQSILRNQIAKFGDHVFKHGSVVLPGNSGYDVNICAVKLTTPLLNSHVYVGGEVVGTSGLKGKIKAVIASNAIDLYMTLYVSYYNTGNLGEKVFGNTESLSISNPLGNITDTKITTAIDASTGAVMAYINKGVFYINGSFVEVSKQSLIISKYSSVANCMVLLKITESIVEYVQDNSLLDPAQGSYNYAAPGADRIKITLTLETLPLGTEVSADYIELMRFEDGQIQEFSRYPKYNELEKTLARRTYDESGDYISNGLKVTVHESNKQPFNGGKVIDGSQDDYAVQVDAGNAYINGFETTNQNPQIVTAPKGRSLIPNHIKSKSISIAPKFGQYFLVTNLKSLPVFSTRSSVNLFDSITTNGVAVQIGTATVVGIDLHETNASDQTNIYKLYVTGVTSTADLSKIGSARYTGGSADVVHELNVPVQGVDFVASELVSFGTSTATVSKWVRGTSTLYVTKQSTAAVPAVGLRITGATSGASGVVGYSAYMNSNSLPSPIITLPIDAIFKVRNNVGTAGAPLYVANISYKVFKEISITPVTGTGSFTISGGTIDPLEAGNVIVTSTTGVQPLSSLSLSGDGLTITYTGAGVGIKISCSVTKTNVPNKTKTLASNASTPDTGLVPSAKVLLSRADVVRIISVTSTVDGDVTGRFSLNNGQTDYAYTRGSLVLTGILPTGTLTATYEYFAHSGTGDYFSIDSYVSSGLVNYYTDIRPYKSNSDSKLYDLRNCLDFRPKFDLYTASLIEMIISDSRITTDVQYYVPRIDSVMFDKGGEAYIEYGVPAEIPVSPTVSGEAIQLGTIFVPAYTYSVADMIVFPSKNKGYKMRDILKLEDRLLNIEKYSLLSQTETTLINNDIIDNTTGLSRFKSGYLVETFSDPDSISDITSREFKASYINGFLCPAMESYSVDMELVSTSGVMLENTVNKVKVISLPYTTKVFSEQKKSTRVTNINPFAVFSWVGIMTLVPASDSFVDTVILPPVYETITNVVIETIVINVPRAWNFQPVPGNVARFASSNTTIIN